MLHRRVFLTGLLAGLLGLTAPLCAQERMFRLSVDEQLHRSGLLKYILPRFSLKTGIKVSVQDLVQEEADFMVVADQTDVMITDIAVPAVARSPDWSSQVAFHAINESAKTGTAYWVILIDAEASPSAKSFVDWLVSDIGQKTVAAYQVDGLALFAPGSIAAPQQQAVMPDGDADAGEGLALLHCGRCHVVNEKNRMGGIGSTPSFAALRSFPDWQDRFLTFWSLNPHPSFTQVMGLTKPFDPNRPPHIAPVEITPVDLDAILAFAATIKPKDLGTPIETR